MTWAGPREPLTDRGQVTRPQATTLVRGDMTRFDRLWEPVVVVVVALAFLIRWL